VIAALLLVKVFARSKQRLAGWLAPEERELLARAMFEDVWTTLRAVPDLDRLLVISAEPYVLARCRRDKITYYEESEQRSHSESVAQGTRWAMNLGVTSLLSLPIDTPAVTPNEISSLLELAHRYSVVVVPSADGSGTNALLRTPPDAIAPHFGPGSCRLHVREAQLAGLSHCVHPTRGLAADIDTPEDLESFLSLDHPCRSTELVRQFLTARRGVPVCS
jgi:2-phospho-L-lactate guanylyltransferase